MSVWSVREWENKTKGEFVYYRSIMVSAVLRTCTTSADLFMRNLRDRVFDLDEVLWIEDRNVMASLFMYMMMSGHLYMNLAAHVVRQGCAIDMCAFFVDNRNGRLVNPMGYAVIHDQLQVVLAMMERGFLCTTPCAGGDTPGSYVDAVELAVECYGRDCPDRTFLKSMLDAANLTAAQLTKYLRELKPKDACMSVVFNEAIATARGQEPYYATAWVWKDAKQTMHRGWRDVLNGHVLPLMRALGPPSLYVDEDLARLRGMRPKRDARGWEEDDDMGGLYMRPNKLRKI